MVEKRKLRQSILRKIRTGVKAEKSTSQIIKDLKDSGLSYRRKNMLYDLRLTAATYRATTSQARRNAKNWFKNIYEPFRKSKHLNSKQATKLWEMTRKQSYKTLKQARLGRAFWDLYKQEF